MRRVLLVTSLKFWRHQNGAAARVYSLFSVLYDAGFNVGLFFIGTLDCSDHFCLEKICIKSRTSVVDGTVLKYSDFFSTSPTVLRGLPRYFQKLWYRFRKKSFPFKRFYNSKILHEFEKYLGIFEPNIILVEYVRFSFLLPQIKDTRQLWLIDTHDVMFKRCAMFKHFSLPHWVEISKQEEIDALNRFDAVIAIQKDEEKLLRNMVESSRVLLVPHSVDVAPLPFLKRDTNEFCVGYLAANNHANYDAIIWFLDRVWPICIEKVKSLRLLVGGSICRRLEDRCDKNVELVGYVEQLNVFYSETDAIVNPVRSGGGLKIKNVEALAYGRPLVTTLVGADGFPDYGNLPFLVAITEQQFIDELLFLLRDEKYRKMLRLHGIKYIEKHFSREAVYKPLLDFICQPSCLKGNSLIG